jgi:hypothetical protein
MYPAFGCGRSGRWPFFDYVVMAAQHAREDVIEIPFERPSNHAVEVDRHIVADIERRPEGLQHLENASLRCNETNCRNVSMWTSARTGNDAPESAITLTTHTLQKCFRNK